ncbi:MAG TPA: hypothetical protein VKV17_14375 [Bryobacteraceae bacterium]|nr:hypothetical protein [Bryobacteraceae bacterium]
MNGRGANLRERSWEPEILDGADLDEDARERCFADLARVHLSTEELAGLIRNVGHSCRRFLILDAVRHWIPHLLFRSFIAPLVNPINAHDGVLSLERAFTPPELRRAVADALDGSPARFRHAVAPLYIRQIVDIRY